MAWSQIVTALAAISVLSLVTSGASQLFVWFRVNRGKRFEPSADSVSVLKPLCGVDASLETNLAMFSRQTHEDLQVVLGMADPADPARGPAQRFRSNYAQSTICLGESTDIINPKVALLDRMARMATGDWIAVSDSNVSVTADYVAETLSHAAPGVGLITHLVSGQGGTSFAAHCENLQLNCFAAPAVCGARHVLSRTCVIGKSMFLRRDVLAEMGGFRAAGNYLAEDYAMGQAVEKLGYRVAMSDVPVVAWHEGWTLSRFFNRHLRWAVMRRRVSTPAYLAEVLLSPAPWLMSTFALAVAFEQSTVPPSWVLAAWFVEWALVAKTYSRMTGRPIRLAALLVNPVREWLTIMIWVLGWFVRVIEWRGKPFRVGKGSRLSPVSPPLSETIADEAQA